MAEKQATDIQWNEATGEVRWTLHAAKEPRVYAVPDDSWVRDRETSDRWCITFRAGFDGWCALLTRDNRQRRMSLASLVYAFDMEPYRVSGPPLRTAPKRQAKRHDTEVDPAAPKSQVVQPAPVEPRRDLPAVALATVHVDGDELGVVRLPGDGPEDGWVSLPSLLAPFGKRTDHAAGLLAGWARERAAIVTSRRGGGHAAETRLVHYRDAPLVIARLDQRGMDEGTKAKHGRYLRVCADVLAGFFLPPRPIAPEPTAVTAAAIGKALAEALAPLAIRLGAIEQRLSEQAPLPHAPALPAVPAGAAATLGGGLTLHAAHVDAVSQRAVARKLGLPQEGTGRSAVGVLADLESVWERAELHRTGSYVSGTGRHGDHRLITPAGVEAMRERAALYLRQVASLGWYVSAGGRLTATPAARPEYSARRVHEAALEAARALRGEQTTMGFDA